MSNFSKSEKEIYELRKQKIAFLNDISSDSFPTKFNESTKISNIINEHRDIEEGIHTGISVTVRGRLLNARSFGKLLFYDILDQSGKIQLLVNSGEIEDVYLRLFENFDIGDIIAVNGEVIKTKKGELSIKVNQSTILSKSLRSFPEKWHGLKDKETRFRQRYLDLIVNPESKKILETRSKVIKLIREYLHENSFVEVETPILQTKAGGAIAKPFTTHHNALGLDMYLRIAPELYLKRLIIGGFEKVFELGKIFRNEGIDQTHLPEFTMLESYQAYVDANSVMDMVEDMCTYVFKNLEDTKFEKHQVIPTSINNSFTIKNSDINKDGTIDLYGFKEGYSNPWIDCNRIQLDNIYLNLNGENFEKTSEKFTEDNFGMYGCARASSFFEKDGE